MSISNEPPLPEIVAVWTMAFGEPPIVTADASLLLRIMGEVAPELLGILGLDGAQRVRLA